MINKNNDNDDQSNDQGESVAAAGADRCPVCDSVMRNNVCPKGCKTIK